jgi:RluA family pseudouridine synthase
VPYENKRPLSVPAHLDGVSLIDFFCGVFTHIPREDWLMRCEERRIFNHKDEPVVATQIVRSGERYYHLLPATGEPAVNADIRIIYEDEAILVLHKPAPLPMHPCGRFNRNTLQYILHSLYAPQHPRPAHRLDANTTGLVVCARTRHFAGRLQPQFTRGEVDKVYLVRVQGAPSWNEHLCELPISAEPSTSGTREVTEDGDEARTQFTVRERFADGTTLLEARPLTGRTNQIRVHLWELGLPVCGDPAYLPDHQKGGTQTLATDDTPLCLHAWRLSFTHPETKQRMTFESELPAWTKP